MKNILAANEGNIRTTWGVAPLPVNFIPVAVNLKLGSRNYGLLMYNPTTDKWQIGAGLVCHSIAKSEAERIVCQADTSSFGHGGERENAGRKKTLPDGAKRRTIILTDEELIAVKELINKMRA